MGVFRKIGKGVGTIGGGLIGGTTKLAGKAVGSKWKGCWRMVRGSRRQRSIRF